PTRRASDLLDCFVHLTVTSTAAQITAKRISNRLVDGVRIHTQEKLNSNHESRCAIPALRSAPVPIGFLDSRQTAMLTYAFDRSDLLSLATSGQERAGKHRRAIHEHRAGAA